MYINPAYEYQLYILKAKTAKTEEDYQKYLSIAIHFLEKMDEGGGLMSPSQSWLSCDSCAL